MLSCAETNVVAEGSRSNDLITKLFLHISSQSSSIAENLTKLENNLDSIKRDVKAKLCNFQSDVSSKLDEVDRDLTQFKESVETTLREQGEQLRLLLSWKRECEIAVPKATLVPGILTDDRTCGASQQCVVQQQKHQKVTSHLKSRVIMGSKGSTMVNGRVVKNAIDIDHVCKTVEQHIPGAIKTISKLSPTGSLVCITFRDHTNGMPAAKCAEQFLNNKLAIGALHHSWVRADQPKAVREGYQRASKFARWFKRRFPEAEQPFYRFHGDHLLLDELLVCPVMHVPDEIWWDEFAHQLDPILEGAYKLFDENAPPHAQCLSSVLDFLASCRVSTHKSVV